MEKIFAEYIVTLGTCARVKAIGWSVVYYPHKNCQLKRFGYLGGL